MMKFFVTLAIVALLGLGLNSCGGDDSPAEKNTPTSKENEGGSQGGDQGGGKEGKEPGEEGKVPGSTLMTKQEQIDWLESTAHEFVTMAPASDFEELTTMLSEAAKVDGSSVEKLAKEIYDQTVQAIGDPTLISYDDYGYYSMSYYNRQFKAAYEIANYKGYFEVQNGAWKLVRSDVNDVQFTFKDSKNATWVLRAEATGPYKKVHMYDMKTRKSNSTYENEKYVIKSYTDITQYMVSVPQKLEVTLTKNGSSMVKTTINTTLSDITNEEFDLSKDDVSANALIEVKDYKINVSQILYKHDASPIVETSVSKNNQQLLNISVTGTLSNVPSVNVSAFTGNYDNSIWEYSDANALVKVDILGKVQLQGTVTKVHSLADKLQAAKDNKQNEQAYKNYINEANEYLDLGLFFNNKDVKQLSVTLMPFERTKYRNLWNGTYYEYQPYNYWEWEGVIMFGDGSGYSTFVNYFSKSNFRSVYGDVENLIDTYSKLIK